MSTATLQKHFSALPLLQPGAYAYYLPAYVLHALDHFTPDDPVAEFTVYNLAPDHEDEISREHYAQTLKPFTEDQISAISAFLELVRADKEFRRYLGDVEPGRLRLTQYWRERWNY